MSLHQDFFPLLVGIPSESECLCTTLGMSCDRLVVPTPSVSLRRLDRLVSGVLMAVVVRIVYEWPTEPHFFRDLSNVCHWLLWWWCCRWIHTLMTMWLWCPLLMGLPLQDGFLTAVYSNVGVRIGVASFDHLCPRIYPGVDRCLCLLPLY